MEYVSSLPQWPGRIITREYVTFAELVDWQNAVQKAQAASEGKELGATLFYFTLLPLVLKIIREWHIEGLPAELNEESFPGSLPLLAWATECITDLVNKTNSIDPNSSGP